MSSPQVAVAEPSPGGRNGFQNQLRDRGLGSIGAPA